MVKEIVCFIHLSVSMCGVIPGKSKWIDWFLISTCHAVSFLSSSKICISIFRKPLVIMYILTKKRRKNPLETTHERITFYNLEMQKMRYLYLHAMWNSMSESRSISEHSVTYLMTIMANLAKRMFLDLKYH